MKTKVKKAINLSIGDIIIHENDVYSVSRISVFRSFSGYANYDVYVFYGDPEVKLGNQLKFLSSDNVTILDIKQDNDNLENKIDKLSKEIEEFKNKIDEMNNREFYTAHISCVKDGDIIKMHKKSNRLFVRNVYTDRDIIKDVFGNLLGFENFYRLNVIDIDDNKFDTLGCTEKFWVLIENK